MIRAGLVSGRPARSDRRSLHARPGIGRGGRREGLDRSIPCGAACERRDPSWMPPLFAVLFGACIGSFLNVCIYRLPRGESVVWPGSRCTSCGRALTWYDNIPILSWVALGGRCRTCKASVSAHVSDRRGRNRARVSRRLSAVRPDAARARAHPVRLRAHRALRHRSPAQDPAEHDHAARDRRSGSSCSLFLPPGGSRFADWHRWSAAACCSRSPKATTAFAAKKGSAWATSSCSR